MTEQTYTDAQVQSIIDKVTRENSADGMDGDSWDRLLVRAALAERQAARSAVGGGRSADRVFIEEIGSDGKPTGYLNEMYGTLERELRNRVEQDGMHGSYPDKLCIKAANAIADLRTALASQIDITNTERGHAERASRILATHPARSVVVSDEDVRAALKVPDDAYVSTLAGWWKLSEPGGVLMVKDCPVAWKGMAIPLYTHRKPDAATQEKAS